MAKLLIACFFSQIDSRCDSQLILAALKKLEVLSRVKGELSYPQFINASNVVVFFTKC